MTKKTAPMRISLPLLASFVLIASLAITLKAIKSPTNIRTLAASSTCTQYQFSSMLGSSGLGNGQINSPYGLFANSSYVFTAESLIQSSMERVQRFNLSGTYSNLTFGSSGSSAGQFKGLRDVATDPSGNIYVTDSLNNRVQKFNGSGVFVTQWAITNPWGIAIDSNSNVYIGDNGTKQIKKFSSSGALLSSWNGNPAFGLIAGLTTDSNYVYATDYTNNRIQKFSVSGVFQKAWGSKGAGTGQFNFPKGIAIDSGRYVYVADTGNQRIQKFDASGNYTTSLGSYGNLNGQFSSPSDVGVDPYGKVYVSDLGNNRIQIFTCVAPTPTPTPTPAPPRLLGWWKLNENTGTIARDSSGNNFNGTVSSATWVPGKYSSALQFAGTSSSRVTVPTNSIIAPSYAITAEGWFKTSDKTLSQTIVSKKHGTGYRLVLNDGSKCVSGNISFLILIGGINRCVNWPISNIANNTWYYATGTYDGISMRLYINGKLVSTRAQTGLIDEGTQPLCIGADASNTSCTDKYFFKGVIDDVRIYNYARTPTQIASDMSGL